MSKFFTLRLTPIEKAMRNETGRVVPPEIVLIPHKGHFLNSYLFGVNNGSISMVWEEFCLFYNSIKLFIFEVGDLNLVMVSF